MSLISLFKKLWPFGGSTYKVRLYAESQLISICEVMAIKERHGKLIYVCKPSKPILQPCKVTESELWREDKFVERTMLPRPMMCLRGETICFFYVRSKHGIK